MKKFKVGDIVVVNHNLRDRVDGGVHLYKACMSEGRLTHTQEFIFIPRDAKGIVTHYNAYTEEYFDDELGILFGEKFIFYYEEEDPALIQHFHEGKNDVQTL
jgi:hypothetical protein